LPQLVLMKNCAPKKPTSEETFPRESCVFDFMVDTVSIELRFFASRFAAETLKNIPKLSFSLQKSRR